MITQLRANKVLRLPAGHARSSNILGRRGTRSISTVAFLVAMVVAAISFPSSSLAAGTCGTAGNYFDNALSSGTATYGDSANIELQTPALCSGAQSFSVAWTMLTGASNSDGWAQIGYGNWSGVDGQTGMHTFTQYIQCATCTPSTGYYAPPDTGYYYKVSYNFTNQDLSMIRGSTSYAITPWNPFSYWSTPFRDQYAAETHHTESDTIGTQSNAASFGGIQKRLSDGTWASDSNLTLQTPGASRYYNEWGTKPSLFYVWTYPL